MKIGRMTRVASAHVIYAQTFFPPGAVVSDPTVTFPATRTSADEPVPEAHRVPLGEADAGRAGSSFERNGGSSPVVGTDTLVIFLEGVTPVFRKGACYSWRDKMIAHVLARLPEDSDVVFVVPEPVDGEWDRCKYGFSEKQMMWEKPWIERAREFGIIVQWFETRWSPLQEAVIDPATGQGAVHPETGKPIMRIIPMDRNNCWNGDGPKDGQIGVQVRNEIASLLREQFYMPVPTVIYIPEHAHSVSGPLQDIVEWKAWNERCGNCVPEWLHLKRLHTEEETLAAVVQLATYLIGPYSRAIRTLMLTAQRQLLQKFMDEVDTRMGKLRAAAPK